MSKPIITLPPDQIARAQGMAHKRHEVIREPVGDQWLRIRYEYRTDAGELVGTGWSLERA